MYSGCGPTHRTQGTVYPLLFFLKPIVYTLLFTQQTTSPWGGTGAPPAIVLESFFFQNTEAPPDGCLYFSNIDQH